MNLDLVFTVIAYLLLPSSLLFILYVMFPKTVIKGLLKLCEFINRLCEKEKKETK